MSGSHRVAAQSLRTPPAETTRAGARPAAAAETAGRHCLDTGFPELDVIRVCAALMVALYHYLNVGPGRLGAAGAPFRAAFEPVAWISSSFWVAVQIFFVLSGVVIAFSADGRSAGDFVRRRALRMTANVRLAAATSNAGVRSLVADVEHRQPNSDPPPWKSRTPPRT